MDRAVHPLSLSQVEPKAGIVFLSNPPPLSEKPVPEGTVRGDGAVGELMSAGGKTGVDFGTHTYMYMSA